MYSNHSVAAVPDFLTNDVVNIVGSTTYPIIVASDTVGERPTLEFNLLGYEVFGGALYGDGDVRARTTNRISTNRVFFFTPIGMGPEVWGLVDNVSLRRGASDRFTAPRMEVVTLGVASPLATETYGHHEFESQGRIEPEDFAGTLDFATMSPFEPIVLEPASETSIALACVQYTGSTRQCHRSLHACLTCRYALRAARAYAAHARGSRRWRERPCDRRRARAWAVRRRAAARVHTRRGLRDVMPAA